MTERLHFQFSLSCIGEGNGNPLHCSCLENPRDRGAWWAAVYGVTQSWIQLKWLSSSSTVHGVSKSQTLTEWLLLWPTPVFLPREFHGQRSLVGSNQWGCKKLDTTEQLTHNHTHTHTHTHTRGEKRNASAFFSPSI